MVLENGIRSRLDFEICESKYCDEGNRTGYGRREESDENLMPVWLSYIDLSPRLLIRQIVKERQSGR